MTNAWKKTIVGLACMTAVTGGAVLQSSPASAAPTEPHEFTATAFGSRETVAYGRALSNAQFRASGAGYRVGNCAEDRDPYYLLDGEGVYVTVWILCQP